MRARLVLAPILLGLAVVVVTVSTAAGVLPGGRQPRPTTTAPSVRTAGGHRISLTGCAEPPDVAAMQTAETPDGPAKNAIVGYHVTTSFSMDEGLLTVEPAPASAAPVVTREQAGCQLASLVGLHETSGPGRVALASVTLHVANQGALATYEHRLAWIMVSLSPAAAPSCPLSSGPRATATISDLEASPNQVVIFDARTGSSAFYVADSFPDCTDGRVAVDAAVAPQVASVPWRLVSRSGDGKSVTLSARFGPCEYPVPGNHLSAPKAQTSLVAVLVFRPAGPACGPVADHEVTVSTSRPTHPLPATLLHAPLGLEAALNHYS